MRYALLFQSTLTISLLCQPVWGEEPVFISPLDQAVEDTSVLSTSLRKIDWDTRYPVGFENVYRIPGHDDKLMRADGALYAIFPQSVYANTAYGDIPLIPHDTVFSIGWPWSDQPIPSELGRHHYFGPQGVPAAAQPSSSLVDDLLLDARINLRLDTRYEPQPYAIEDMAPRDIAVFHMDAIPHASVLDKIPQESAQQGEETTDTTYSEETSGEPDRTPLPRYVYPIQFEMDSDVQQSESIQHRTIVTDMTYRSRRLRELMENATRDRVDS